MSVSSMNLSLVTCSKKDEQNCPENDVSMLQINVTIGSLLSMVAKIMEKSYIIHQTRWMEK